MRLAALAASLLSIVRDGPAVIPSIRPDPQASPPMPSPQSNCFSEFLARKRPGLKIG